MSFDWKSIVKTVAPVLGTALGGPMAGAATKFIADKFLGNPDASEKEVATAIQNATPEQLIHLKQLDQEFDLEYIQKHLENTQDARAMHVANKDLMPAIVSCWILLIFSVAQSCDLFIHKVDPNQLNALGDFVFLVIGFWLGSSSELRKKLKA